MKLYYLPIALAAALAAQTVTVRAEDPATPGKAGASNTVQQQQPVAPQAAPAPIKSEKDQDFGKAGTSTSPSATKEHGAAEANTDRKLETKAEDAEAVKPVESRSSAAQIEAAEAQKRAEQQRAAAAASAADKQAAPPVSGNNGTVGGAKASQ